MDTGSKILQFQACRNLDEFMHSEDEALWRHRVIRPHKPEGLVPMPGGGCTGSHDSNEHRWTADDGKRRYERARA